VKKVILPVFTVIRVGVINAFPLYVATVVSRCVQSVKDDQIFYADVTADVQTVVYVSIEENTVGLVINAITGYAMIVETAFVIVRSVKKVNLPVFTVKRLGVINAFVMYVANVVYRCVQNAKDHQIFYADVTVDVQGVV
jgi:hypothetical protein